jgi:hypothetical protein
MLAPSETALTPLRIRVAASFSSSSFCVADGVGRDLPDAAAGHEAGRGAPALGVRVDPAALDLLDLLEQTEVDALLVDDVAGGVRAGDGVRAEGGQLLDRVDRDVARAGHDRRPALQVLAALAQHRRREEDVAVARRLRADQRAAPARALAGEDAGLPAVGDAAVLAEQVADLPAADADVTGRDVGVLADVPVQFRHERLAEPHDLRVAAPVRVEVAAALAAADAEAGQGVLEDLLEAQELDDAQVHGRVEAQTALVRAQRAVELDAEAPVDVDPAPVVLPRHPEDDLPLRFDQPLDQARLGVLGAGREHRRERLQYLVGCLVELGLGRIAVLDLGEEVVERGPGLASRRHRGPFWHGWHARRRCRARDT